MVKVPKLPMSVMKRDMEVEKTQCHNNVLKNAQLKPAHASRALLL